MPRKKRCLTCPRQAKRSGLCDPCYYVAYRAIKSGKYTRQYLESEGLILPSRRGERATAWQKAVKAVKRRKTTAK